MRDKEEATKRNCILAKNITARGPLSKDLMEKTERDEEHL